MARNDLGNLGVDGVGSVLYRCTSNNTSVSLYKNNLGQLTTKGIALACSYIPYYAQAKVIFLGEEVANGTYNANRDYKTIYNSCPPGVFVQMTRQFGRKAKTFPTDDHYGTRGDSTIDFTCKFLDDLGCEIGLFSNCTNSTDPNIDRRYWNDVIDVLSMISHRGDFYDGPGKDRSLLQV